MKLGNRFFILRFGTNIKRNCIDEHSKVIAKNGWCWFGKIGNAPSTKVISDVMGQDDPHMILYTKHHAYECNVCEVTNAKPGDGYPDYYENELFAKGIFPSAYFKLTQITEISMKELKNYFIVRSKNSVLAALNRSAASYFYAEYPDRDNLIDKEIKEVNIRESIHSNKLSVNDCVHKADGICQLKSCVNYGYSCERPNMCIKLKR